MSDFCEQPTDPLDLLLAPTAAEPDPALRQRLLTRTTALIRRRRRLRRLVRVAALAACYVAGLFTMHGIPVPPNEPASTVAPTPSAAALAPAPTALVLEWQALESPAPAPQLYLQAGDRYLAENGDPRAATRCYGNALNLAIPQDLVIDPSDSWLLMAIKDARQKEKDDAKRIQ